MKHFVITPSMGKRLIAKALVKHPAVKTALEKATLLIVAGTTNGYVAQEVLKSIGQEEGFTRVGFRRGMVTPPHFNPAEADKAHFIGDVAIVHGQWLKGKEIFDIIDDMKAPDVVLKGANALNLPLRRAAVLVGHPMAGTAGALAPAVFGRRVQLIIPIGLEKRVGQDLDALAELLNDPSAEGPRFFPLPGKAFTEIDAIELLTGAQATLTAGGGIFGAEGSVWLTVAGTADQLHQAQELFNSLIHEGPCEA
jgi:hypothetical protein